MPDAAAAVHGVGSAGRVVDGPASHQKSGKVHSWGILAPALEWPDLARSVLGRGATH